MAADKVKEIPKLIKDANQRQYLPSDELGSGGFATCWRAQMIDRHNTPEAPECALKAVRSTIPKNLCQRFRLELVIQSKLRHANIVEMYRAFTFQDITYVALELCPNGSLTDMIRRRKYLTMSELRHVMIQVCGAVKYLHARDVVHRDIKAGNIFLDENMNAKLGDFGLAAIMEPDPKSTEHLRRTTFCGTPNYLAPEILSRSSGGHGMSVDIWAIGILLYYLAVGKAPFHSKSKDEIYLKLKKGDYAWPDVQVGENDIPDSLQDLVGSILVEEARRPSLDEIVSHPFFSGGHIPDGLDQLCRTRRPRYARIGSCRVDPKVYRRLCINSNVGPAAIIGAQCSEPPKSLLIMLAEEHQQGVKLQIPLREGKVYAAQRPSNTNIIPIIHEDAPETKRAVVLPPSTSANQFKKPQLPIVPLQKAVPTKARTIRPPLLPYQQQAAMAKTFAEKRDFWDQKAQSSQENLGSTRVLRERPRRAGVRYQ